MICELERIFQMGGGNEQRAAPNAGGKAGKEKVGILRKGWIARLHLADETPGGVAEGLVLPGACRVIYFKAEEQERGGIAPAQRRRDILPRTGCARMLPNASAMPMDGVKK